MRIGANLINEYFTPLWLRDNCQCPKCIHLDTKQRQVDTFSIPSTIMPTNIEYKGNNTIEIGWDDGHHSTYPMEWLRTRQRPFKQAAGGLPLTIRPCRMLRDDGSPYPTVYYDQIMAGDQGVREWLETIHLWGFCLVKDVPVNPESTKALLEKIAFIRETHYGGFYDFTADMTFKDTAYTTDAIGAHTDNTYFTDPSRLQMLHLLSHTEGEGGASLLVDGFLAAKTMLKEKPHLLHSLTKVPQPFHASGNEDVCITPLFQAPVLSVSPGTRQLYQIRWNNYDRAAKTDWTYDQQQRWYEAARYWNSIIQRPELERWMQLEPGTALIFDNWRMLHGRTAFTGKRRMCGGYINNDDFLSRLRLLKFGRESVLNNIGNTTLKRQNPNIWI